MLLQNAAAGGSLLAAEAAGLLSGESGEYGGEERAVPALWWLGLWKGGKSKILDIPKNPSTVHVDYR